MKSYQNRTTKTFFICVRYKAWPLDVRICVEPAEPEINVSEQVSIAEFNTLLSKEFDAFVWDRYCFDRAFAKEIDELVKEAR